MVLESYMFVCGMPGFVSRFIFDLAGTINTPVMDSYMPFRLTSTLGALWIEPLEDAALRTRLHLKGANWAGFQADGCPHALWSGTTVDAYISFLVRHRFNSVRLPLSSVLVNDNTAVGFNCAGFRGQSTLLVLDDVLTRLQAAGILVVLDMHTSVQPEANTGLWCGRHTECTAEAEAPILRAWQTLARRYCAYPNVIAADLYNEPFTATWGVGSATQRWDLAAARLGNAVLAECPRLLIFVEGVGQHGGGWNNCAPNGCCESQPTAAASSRPAVHAAWSQPHHMRMR